MAWDDDLGWIEGELVFEELEGGFWTCNFADKDTDAPLGGSVVLGNTDKLDGFKAGQRVRIFGEPMHEAASIFMAGPMYEVLDVKLAN